jgi:hypothetical protein
LTRTIEILDKEGKPVRGAWVMGVSDDKPMTVRLPDSKATIFALHPKQSRLVIAYHPGLRQVGTMQVRGDEKGVLTLRLGNMAQVKGRLLRAGKPFRGAQVAMYQSTVVGQEFEKLANPSPAVVNTDEDGRFTLPQVLPGVELRLSISKDEILYTVHPARDMTTPKGGHTLYLLDSKVVEIP